MTNIAVIHFSYPPRLAIIVGAQGVSPIGYMVANVICSSSVSATAMIWSASVSGAATGSATLTAKGDLAANVTCTATGSATLTAASANAMSAIVTCIATGTAQLTGKGAIAASVTCTATGVATLSNAGDTYVDDDYVDPGYSD